MKGKAKHVVGGGGEESMKYSNNNGGVAWSRGPLLGKGGFGSVYLASLKNPKSRNGYYPPVMAVKSAEVSASCSLQKEKEYASGGTLAGLIKKSDGVGLPELDVKRYTSTKAGEFVAKIGDFGLAKKSEKRNKKRKFDPYLRGTTLYMAPETVANHVQEPPCDIWALGCVVLEMLTGKQAWDVKPDVTIEELMRKIGVNLDGGEFVETSDAESVEWTDTLCGTDDEFSGSSFYEEWSFTSDEGSCFSPWSDDEEGITSNVDAMTHASRVEENAVQYLPTCTIPAGA
ncbi:hypothetical protein D5086_000368 [Populus alba]|uniref:Uncharacterized protein n=1 Tax=Populus alba TaxID=43335 RepID=A0ACC4CWW1_POPAL